MIRFHLSTPTAMVLAVTILLSGCAAQTAYKEGQVLLGQGKAKEGLAKLQEAQRLEPGSAEYRLALLQARDQILKNLLDQAGQQQRLGRPADAERLYREALTFQETNDRALTGLRSIERQRRAESLLQEAEAAFAKKDNDVARLKLKNVLLEMPGNEAALSLMRKLDELSARPLPETALSAAYKKTITIEFKDAPLRSVFEVISRSSGLNFLFDKDVRTDQKTSIFLKGSTIEAAVNLTLLTNQLDQRVLDANTILIYPNTQAKQRDYQALTVKSFYLSNAEAKVVAATLKAVLKTRDVVVDEKLNLLIVRDSPEAIKLAEKLVALHDVAEPEVMLEVEILEVSRNRLLELGIRYPDQLTLTPLSANTLAGGALTLADLRDLNSTRIGATIGPITINARKNDSDANILANPRIRVRNREKAKILIGERVPNITSTATSTGFVSESITYVDVGLKLDVEPTIYLDGEVAIKVALEVSNIISQIQTRSGSIAYRIGTRTAQTVLRLKDGENQVLAGLINDEDRRSGNKIPGLGEIPVLGRLFGSQSDEQIKSEIVLSITPRILRNIRRPDANIIEFESGTESALGARASGSAANIGQSPKPAGAPINPGTSPRLGISAPASDSTTAVASTSPSNVQTQSADSVAPSSAIGAASNAAGALPAPTPASAVTGTASLRWQGPTTLKVGDSFALQLFIQSDQAVVSIPMALGFDPRALQVTSVTEGDFLRQGGGQTTFTSRVDPNGQVLATGTRSGDSGASTLGSVATVNFRVNAAPSAETRIQLLTIAPIGLGGKGVTAELPPPHVIRFDANATGSQ